jgi:hypothetical protein
MDYSLNGRLGSMLPLSYTYVGSGSEVGVGVG